MTNSERADFCSKTICDVSRIRGLLPPELLSRVAINVTHQEYADLIRGLAYISPINVCLADVDRCMKTGRFYLEGVPIVPS